jgi:threonine dehydratase
MFAGHRSSRSTVPISACPAPRWSSSWNIFSTRFVQDPGAFRPGTDAAHPGSGNRRCLGRQSRRCDRLRCHEGRPPGDHLRARVASPAKLAQIRDYGADLRISGDSYDDALTASRVYAADSGAAVVHAYDQPETLLGQGTVALEFEEQAPDLDAVLVAVGGGGLIGGMAAWYGGSTRLIAVEPAAAPTLSMALNAGRPVDSPAGGLAADSLAPRRVGELMFPLARRFIAEAVLVADDSIAAAQRALWKTLRVVAEPGGAAALAALLEGSWKPHPGQRIGVLLCGANTTAVQFPGPLASVKAAALP